MRIAGLQDIITVSHIMLSASHNNSQAVFQQCLVTPAGDASPSQKKHAMLPRFYSFRALGIPVIEDYSCCHLQEKSGNNVVILFNDIFKIATPGIDLTVQEHC